MNRRGFLSGILALGTAPAIVRAENLMVCRGILVPRNAVLTLDMLKHATIGLDPAPDGGDATYIVIMSPHREPEFWRLTAPAPQTPSAPSGA